MPRTPNDSNGANVPPALVERADGTIIRYPVIPDPIIPDPIIRDRVT
jgi:hypothetical protein